jgi:hypothetical protein
MSDHAKYEQLAAGFALSALEPEDELAFREHLLGCERCAQSLLDHSTTMGHLAFAAEAEEPPASVLEGIRAGVRATRSEGLRPVEAVASMEVARHRRERARWRNALVGVAAGLVLAGGITLVGGLGDDRPQQQTSALTELVASLTKPGARVVDLKGQGHAVAILNGTHLSLAVQGLPVNDRASSVYVLWGKSRYGGVSAVGTFDVGSTDPVAINDLGTVTPGTLEALMVTKEEGRTAPAVSTKQPVMAGEA